MITHINRDAFLINHVDVTNILHLAKKNYDDVHRKEKYTSDAVYFFDELINIMIVYEQQCRGELTYIDFKRVEYLNNIIQVLNITGCTRVGIQLYFTTIKSLVNEIIEFEKVVSKIEELIK